jgi:hypothetical protein
VSYRNSYTDDRRLTVRHERSPSVVGVIVALLILSWIFRGFLGFIFAAVYQNGGVSSVTELMSLAPPTEGYGADEYGSVSYLIMTMLWEAVGVLIAYAAIAWGLLTWLIRDVLDGFTLLARDVYDRWKGEEEITTAVTAAEVQPAPTPAAKDVFANLTFDDKLKVVAKDSRDRINEVRTEMKAGFADLTALIQSTIVPPEEVEEEPTAPPAPRRRAATKGTDK